MAAVIAFFFAGRFGSTRRMLPQRSVLMSLSFCLVVSVLMSPFSDWLSRPFLWFRHGAACAQGLSRLAHVSGGHPSGLSLYSPEHAAKTEQSGRSVTEAQY